MSENTKNPAVQNPSKADTSFLEWEPYWKAFNEFRYILDNLPQSMWDGNYQQTIPAMNDICLNETTDKIPGRGQLSASDAAKRLIACAQQLQTSPNTAIAGLAGYILTWSQNIEYIQEHGG